MTGVNEGGVRVVVKEGESYDVSILGIYPIDTMGLGEWWWPHATSEIS